MKKSLHMNRTLRAALLVLMLGAFGAGDVFADGYDYAEVCPSGQMLYYKIDPDDANAVIVVPPYYYYFQDGPHYEFWGEGYEKPVGDVIIPERLNNGLVVKEIGYNFFYVGRPWFAGAFEDCTEVTSVIMGNSVVTIGGSSTYSGAFSGCTNLTSVIFGEGVANIEAKAFRGCSSLATISLPNSLKTIEERAFCECSNLASINIPNSVNYIGEAAFRNTKWYNDQNDGILYLDDWCLGNKGDAPAGALVIKEGTRGIANWAFGSKKGRDDRITSVVFPHSLAYIGEGAFAACSDLVSIDLPISLISIGMDAFGYTDITSITIPKSVIEIGARAFADCSRLTSIYYNAEDAECNQAFGWCSNLATLIIGPDVRNLDGNAFKRCNTAHLVVALGATPAVLGSGAFSDLAENAMLMVPCGKKMTYFSQWNMFPYDNILENCDQSPVTMGNIGTGGSITASTTNAQMGEEVQLTITPDAGMTLASISISNANDPAQTIPYYFIGKASSRIGFVMPSFGVSVTAAFRASGASVGENSILAEAYPNPTNGKVTIEASDLRHVSIFNAIGQQVYDSQADGDAFECDLSCHEPGVYLIRLETAHGIATKRVVLTK